MILEPSFLAAGQESKRNIKNLSFWLLSIRPDCVLFPHALKGQKLLAQGSALGDLAAQTRRPVRAKALKVTGQFIKLLPLQGVISSSKYTQGVALG